jgi:hypothetical protein
MYTSQTALFARDQKTRDAAAAAEKAALPRQLLQQ